MLMMNEGEHKPPLYHTCSMSSIKYACFFCVVCTIRRKYRLIEQFMYKITIISVKSEGTYIFPYNHLAWDNSIPNINSI